MDRRRVRCALQANTAQLQQRLRLSSARNVRRENLPMSRCVLPVMRVRQTPTRQQGAMLLQIVAATSAHGDLMVAPACSVLLASTKQYKGAMHAAIAKQGRTPP